MIAEIQGKDRWCSSPTSRPGLSPALGLGTLPAAMSARPSGDPNSSRVAIAVFVVRSASMEWSRTASIAVGGRSASISSSVSKGSRVRTFLFSGLVVLLAAFFSLPGTASAARPCDSISISEDAKARVATVGVSCRFGRKIAERYFESVLNGERHDGKTKDGSIYYAIKGFRCLTGLAGTQMFCHRHDRWVFASSRPEDHPSTWR